jgi:hypothetical protein
MGKRYTARATGTVLSGLTPEVREYECRFLGLDLRMNQLSADNWAFIVTGNRSSAAHGLDTLLCFSGGSDSRTRLALI